MKDKHQKLFRITLVSLFSLMIIGIISLLFALVFSVYPNYILKANHGKFFMAGQKIGNTILDFFVDTNYERFDDKTYSILRRINQPFMRIKKPNELPSNIFLSKPMNAYVYHSPMMPDPFVTFALLPGKYLGVENSIQQFRYDKILKKKKENEYRIFITGGSTAWGAIAPNNDSTIAGFLERILRKKIKSKNIKVITAAAGAWNSTQERIWIFNRITEYEPDLIISYSGHNDIFDVHLRHKNLFNSYWYDGAYYYNSILEYENYNRGTNISDDVRNYHKIINKHFTSKFPDQTIKNIKIITSYLEKINCKYFYILQPIREKERKAVSLECDKLRNSLSKFAKENKTFQFYDDSSLFDGRDDIFFDRCHIGDKGNKLIAERLSKIIIDKFFKNYNCF